MKTLPAPAVALPGAGMASHDAIVLDPATLATIVGTGTVADAASLSGGAAATSHPGGELKPLTFALPANVLEATSISTGNELKPLTLTLPSNLAASLGLTTALQPAQLGPISQIQIPTNVLPVALTNGTVANVPISMTNAFFTPNNQSVSDSLPQL